MTHSVEIQSKIIDMYNSGERLKVIEAFFGIHMPTIINILHKNGVSMRREKGKKESAIMIRWYSGLSKAQIARETGYCWLTVHNTIKKAA